MIKHWKMVVTIGFIVLVFSIFYVQLGQEVETYPSFTLQTKEGDLDIVQSIELYGDYQTEESTHLFSFNLGSTMYVPQMPYLERLSGFYKKSELERLKQLYPGYMRGKNEAVSTYAENELYVIQGDMDWGKYSGIESANAAFNLSVLHKELNKQVRFNIPIPEGDQSSFISLEDMYAVGENLHLVTSHLREMAGGIEAFELRNYTIQMDRGKISKTDVIYTWEQSNPGEEVMVTAIKNDQSVLSDQRLILLKRVVKDGAEVEEELKIDDRESDEISHELIAYDFRTKSLETYRLPSELKSGTEFISYVNNSDVYMIQETDDDLLIIEWKLGSDEQPEPIVVPTNRTVQSYTTSLIDEFLYVYVGDGAQGTNIGEVHALYVPTGEWLYKGDVTSNRRLASEEEVIIHTIESIKDHKNSYK